MNNIYKIKTQDVPDHYEMEIHFITGHKEKVDAVSHTIINQNSASLLSIRTKEDAIRWIALTNVREIIFDLNFSKILEAKDAKEKETRKKMLENINLPEEVKKEIAGQLEVELLNERYAFYKNHLRSISLA